MSASTSRLLHLFAPPGTPARTCRTTSPRRRSTSASTAAAALTANARRFRGDGRHDQARARRASQHAQSAASSPAAREHALRELRGHPRLIGQFVDVIVTEVMANSLRGRVLMKEVACGPLKALGEPLWPLSPHCADAARRPRHQRTRLPLSAPKRRTRPSGRRRHRAWQGHAFAVRRRQAGCSTTVGVAQGGPAPVAYPGRHVRQVRQPDVCAWQRPDPAGPARSTSHRAGDLAARANSPGVRLSTAGAFALEDGTPVRAVAIAATAGASRGPWRTTSTAAPSTCWCLPRASRALRCRPACVPRIRRSLLPMTAATDPKTDVQSSRCGTG